MTWFVQLQQANQILAAREAEASRRSLARLAAGQVHLDPQRPSVGVVRRSAARLALVVGRSATRIARAIDAEVVRVA
jgi:hypothetical protein